MSRRTHPNLAASGSFEVRVIASAILISTTRQERAERIVEPGKVAKVRPRPGSLLVRGKLRASRGRFRLIGCDTFDHSSADFLIADYDNLDDAITEATARVAKYGMLNVYHVYSDTGEAVFSTR